jgi:isopenicillin-N epimerase
VPVDSRVAPRHHLRVASPLASHWGLDPTITFLNHGSFGACPREVLRAQAAHRDALEAEPVRYMVRELEPRLDHARTTLAAFMGADPDGLVFVTNATEGVNTVLARLPLAPGDAVLTTDHAYGACKNALDDMAARRGVEVIVARVPFPLASPDEVVAAVEAAVTPRVRLAMLDHITSQTGLVFPIEALVAKLQARGVDCLVDGAHAPGMVPLELDRLGAAYYTGNCHKWLCTPKGSAFLWVRADRRDHVRPLVISHGARTRRTDKSRFLVEFDWTGTRDPSAVLSIPAALEFMAGLVPGGWPAIRAQNHTLVVRARQHLLDLLGIAAPAPAEMLGSLATVPLPPARPGAGVNKDGLDLLGDTLLAEANIEVPVFPWPAPPARMLRVAAQLYNDEADYLRLVDALRTRL